MLLLTIGIILLGLAGIGVSYFWYKVITDLTARQETINDNHNRNLEWIHEQAKLQHQREKILIDFIDKNITERVVHTEGYANESKLDYSVVDEDEEPAEDETQELDTSQFEVAKKHEPIN